MHRRGRADAPPNALSFSEKDGKEPTPFLEEARVNPFYHSWGSTSLSLTMSPPRSSSSAGRLGSQTGPPRDRSGTQTGRPRDKSGFTDEWINPLVLFAGLRRPPSRVRAPLSP